MRRISFKTLNGKHDIIEFSDEDLSSYKNFQQKVGSSFPDIPKINQLIISQGNKVDESNFERLIKNSIDGTLFILNRNNTINQDDGPGLISAEDPKLYWRVRNQPHGGDYQLDENVLMLECYETLEQAFTGFNAGEEKNKNNRERGTGDYPGIAFIEAVEVLGEHHVTDQKDSLKLICKDEKAVSNVSFKTLAYFKQGQTDFTDIGKPVHSKITTQMNTNLYQWLSTAPNLDLQFFNAKGDVNEDLSTVDRFIADALSTSIQFITSNFTFQELTQFLENLENCLTQDAFLKQYFNNTYYKSIESIANYYYENPEAQSQLKNIGSSLTGRSLKSHIIKVLKQGFAVDHPEFKTFYEQKQQKEKNSSDENKKLVLSTPIPHPHYENNQKLLVLDIEGTLVSGWEPDFEKRRKELITNNPDLPLETINLGIENDKKKNENLKTQGSMIEGYDYKPVFHPDLLKILENFKDQGFIIAIATGTNDTGIEEYRTYFQAAGLAQYIDAYTPNIPESDTKDGKVDKLNKYADQFKVNPENIYFFDDGPGNIKRAKNAGYENAYLVSNESPLVSRLNILLAALNIAKKAGNKDIDKEEKLEKDTKEFKINIFDTINNDEAFDLEITFTSNELINYDTFKQKVLKAIVISNLEINFFFYESKRFNASKAHFITRENFNTQIEQIKNLENLEIFITNKKLCHESKLYWRIRQKISNEIAPNSHPISSCICYENLNDAFKSYNEEKRNESFLEAIEIEGTHIVKPNKTKGRFSISQDIDVTEKLKTKFLGYYDAAENKFISTQDSNSLEIKSKLEKDIEVFKNAGKLSLLDNEIIEEDNKNNQPAKIDEQKIKNTLLEHRIGLQKFIDIVHKYPKISFILGFLLFVVPVFIVLGIYLISTPSQDKINTFINHLNSDNSDYNNIDVSYLDENMQTAANTIIESIKNDIQSKKATLDENSPGKATTEKITYILWTKPSAGTNNGKEPSATQELK